MTSTPSPLDKPAADPAPSPHDRTAELAEKHQRLHTFLEKHHLDAVLLRRNDNLAWLTAGAIDRRVLLPSETGIPTLLFRRDGHVFSIVPGNEAARLADEDLPGLDFEPVTTPWHESLPAQELARLAGGEHIGADSLTPGCLLVDLTSLRTPLTAGEITRYRWLGKHTAEATALVLEALEPGITEREMSARVAYELWRRGIEPSVLLMAVDNRIRNYKHAIAHTATLQRYGMLNLCARRWGLCISITRFVHFGPLPQDLAQCFAAAASVNAQLLDATRAGVTSAQLFAVTADAYRAAGYPGEETQHHQGGATGYMERTWVATPNGTETVADPEAFAWNPSIRGGKVEDTTLLQNGSIEVLTPTPSLPVVQTAVDRTVYTSAGVLVRD